MKRTLPWVAALMLAACSPALNWRSVPLDGAALTATLPCKPDHAVRTVEMAGLPVELAMARQYFKKFDNMASDPSMA